MDLQRFQSELPVQFDDLYHPSSITGRISTGKDLIKYTTDLTGFIKYLLQFGITLLTKNELFLLVQKPIPGKQRMSKGLGVKNRFLQIEPGMYSSLQRKAPSGNKVGFCFYNHGKDKRGLFCFLRTVPHFLADQAVIIINNANEYETRKISYSWLTGENRVISLWDLPTPADGYHTWGNGILIITFNTDNR